MSVTVTVHEAETRLGELLEQAHQGEEIIVAKAGRPYARLVPVATTKPRRQPGRLPGRVDDTFFEPLPDAELNAWEGG